MTDIAMARVERAISVAQKRAERIRGGMQSFIATRKEIATAYAERDWFTLGYASFEAYVESEFSEARLRLSPDERREAVAELRRAGMSTRAIGAALGVSKDTAARDLSTVSDETVPDRITGTDGREQPASRPAPKPTDTPGPAEADAAPSAGPGLVSPEPGPEQEPVAPVPPAGRYRNPPQGPDAEERRQRLVATHQLCEVVVTVAQMRGFDTGWKYDPAMALPGRAVTTEVLADARQAIDELLKIWDERELS